MKKSVKVLVVLIGINFVATSISFADVDPLINDIMSRGGIRATVEAYIIKLQSSDPLEKGRGALELGKVGELAVPAIPYLISNLGNSVELVIKEWKPRQTGWTTTFITSAGKEAAITLVIIGAQSPKEVIPSLLEFMKESNDKMAKQRAAFALKAIGMPNWSSELMLESGDYKLMSDPIAYQNAEHRAMVKSYEDYDRMIKWWDECKDTFKSHLRNRNQDFHHPFHSPIPY